MELLTVSMPPAWEQEKVNQKLGKSQTAKDSQCNPCSLMPAIHTTHPWQKTKRRQSQKNKNANSNRKPMVSPLCFALLLFAFPCSSHVYLLSFCFVSSFCFLVPLAAVGNTSLEIAAERGSRLMQFWWERFVKRGS